MGTAPSPWLAAVAAAPQSRPTPSPGGPAVDAANLQHARELGRSAEVSAGDALRGLYDATIGDDLRTALDPQAPIPQRLLHGALLGGMVFGPEEAGLKAVGKGVYVAAEHAADVLAGRALSGVGRLIIRDGAEPNANELRLAASLVREGRTVETVPISRLSGIRTPDFLVDGVRTELKTISKVTGRDTTSAVRNIIERGFAQSRHMIVDIRHQPGFTEELSDLTVARIKGAGGVGCFDTIRMIGKSFDKVYDGSR